MVGAVLAELEDVKTMLAAVGLLVVGNQSYGSHARKTWANPAYTLGRGFVACRAERTSLGSRWDVIPGEVTNDAMYRA